MCDSFTFENVGIVVKSIGDYLNSNMLSSKGVLVGYDPRFMSEDFAAFSAKILSKMGIKVLVTDRDTPTPVVAYTVKDLNLAGAIMFTASHNPPEYNGIKWIPHYGGPANKGITAQIERAINSNCEAEYVCEKFSKDLSFKGLETIDPKESYERAVMKLIDVNAIKRANVKVVYDPMHGAGRGYLDDILRKVGCEVQVIREDRDPLFEGGTPDPCEERLAKLRNCVIGSGADLGLATDGDSDRFGVIDARGNYICPNKVISLLLLHLIRDRNLNGKVVRTVATTHLIDKIARKSEMEVVETPVGFKYICEEMLNSDVVIGGEESGGLSIMGHVPEKDGILANLLMVELVAMSNKGLFDVLQDLVKEFGEVCNKRLDCRLEDMEKAASALDRLKTFPDSLNGSQVAKVKSVDGIKVELTNGDWFLARMSGTEPVIRIYGEASKEEMLSSMLEEVSTYMGLS